MKLAIVTSLIAGAAAFSPAARQSSSTALKMSFAGEVGAQQPLGFFDPLGIVADADQDRFDRLRFVEIKHGRIAMLAVVGYLVQEAGIRLPGTIDYSGLKFTDIPNGFSALKAVPIGGILQMLFFIGLLEANVMKDITGGEHVGDFRNDFIDFGWYVPLPSKRQSK
jgi:Chlorophyll A-B binding protein